VHKLLLENTGMSSLSTIPQYTFPLTYPPSPSHTHIDTLAGLCLGPFTPFLARHQLLLSPVPLGQVFGADV